MTTTRIAWKRRRRMTSGGMFRESRCGRYRLYESVFGGYAASVREGDFWRPLERREDGSVFWHRKQKLAVEAVETHLKKGGAT